MDRDEQSLSWTTVDRFLHPTDAHIAAGLLESEGIPVFLLGINHASANWLLSNALGGIQLQVPADHVEDAKRLLADTAAADEDVERCPSCGSTESTPMTNSRKVAILAVHLFSIPLPWQKQRVQCGSCGHEWRQE